MATIDADNSVVSEELGECDRLAPGKLSELSAAREAIRQHNGTRMGGNSW
jgi:hypothetical protein